MFDVSLPNKKDILLSKLIAILVAPLSAGIKCGFGGVCIMGMLGLMVGCLGLILALFDHSCGSGLDFLQKCVCICVYLGILLGVPAGVMYETKSEYLQIQHNLLRTFDNSRIRKIQKKAREVEWAGVPEGALSQASRPGQPQATGASLTRADPPKEEKPRLVVEVDDDGANLAEQRGSAI